MPSLRGVERGEKMTDFNSDVITIYCDRCLQPVPVDEVIKDGDMRYCEACERVLVENGEV